MRDPKGCKTEVIQGSHKFLCDVIEGSEPSPKNSIFIGLFNKFTPVPIKDYIFSRMTKKILQELALCITQELISFGPSHAQNLKLVLEETKAGDKTVVIDRSDDEFPIDHEFIRDIDEAFFRLSDASGASPDKKIASGQGHPPPYSPPDAAKFFTPIKANPRSLAGEIEVRESLNPHDLCYNEVPKF